LETNVIEYTQVETELNAKLIDIPIEFLAQQLTIFESNLFVELTIPEIVNYASSPQPKENAGQTLRKLQNHNSKLSRWIISTVLQTNSPKEQGSLCKKFCRLAKCLFQLKNYNACAKILEGLFDDSLRKIQKYQAKHFPNMWNNMTSLALIFSSVNEYDRFTAKTYYEYPPFIPFLDFGLARLQTVDSKFSTFISKKDGHIDFSKMRILGSAFASTGFCIPDAYNFSIYNVDPSVQQLIDQLNPLSSGEILNLVEYSTAKMSQTILEMELAERDAEINAIKEQLKKHEEETDRVVQELNLEQLIDDDTPAPITQAQLKQLITLLAFGKASQHKKRHRIKSIV